MFNIHDLPFLIIGFIFGMSTALLFPRYLSAPNDIHPQPKAFCPPCPQCLGNGLGNSESDRSLKVPQTYVENKNMKTKLEDMETPFSVTTRKQYSCNETYGKPTDARSVKFSKGDKKPVFQSYTVQKCSNPPTKETTTLILSHPDTESSRFLEVVQTALPEFTKVILVALKSEIEQVVNADWYSKWSGTKLFTVAVESHKNYGDAMNIAIDLVTSPLVLVAPGLTYLNFDIDGQKLDVQRLIRMLETVENAGAVGGAVKDVINGHWTRGCYQMDHMMYTLKYTEGYRRSYFECLFCNHLTSPFVARTSFVKTIRFPSDNHALFRDFFYRVKRSGKIVVSCPDVMFYIKPISESDSELEKFGERWDIGQMIDFDNKKRKILYFREGPLDKRPLNNKKCAGEFRRKSLFRHPGCRYNLMRFIQYVCKTLEEAGIYYEIKDGTLVGVVKFDYVLPWELDADITIVPVHSINDVYKKMGPIWRKVGITVNNHGVQSYGLGNINLYLHGWKCELWFYPQSMLTQYKELPRTRVNLGGQWLPTLENPAYFVRWRYGQEIFKHVEHYIIYGKSHSRYPYHAGKFFKCTKPGHQGCLDQMEADGNIQFREWM